MSRLFSLIVLACFPIGFVNAGNWFTLLDWETPQCVDSSGPILNGPVAKLFEYRDAEDKGVVVAYSKGSGKIGGVYFLNRETCEKYAAKYQQLWLNDRNK